MLMLQLKSLNGVVVEPFDDTKEYDLVITNTNLATNTTVYRMTELGSDYDLKEIKKLTRKVQFKGWHDEILSEIPKICKKMGK